MNRKFKKTLSITSKFIVLGLVILLCIGVVYAKNTKFDTFFKNLISSPQQNTTQLNSTGKDGTLTDNELDQQVTKIVDAMSVEQMVGQMLMVGFSGTEPDYYITRMINLRHIGGVILFNRNIQNSNQVIKLNNELQKLASKQSELPLFIAVDQEGGVVDRFKDVITTHPAAPKLGQMADTTAADTAAYDVAQQLKAMGVNVNFAPVLDVASGNSIMIDRSYGDDPQLVAKMGLATWQGYRKAGIIPCVKHFPGLGQATHDPHVSSVSIKASLAELNERDLVPFKKAIADQIELIMISHAVYEALDAKNPASASPVIQQNILRDMFGYQGIIVSDDLEMDAATNYNNIGDFGVQAVLAGTDMLLVCHTPEQQKQVYEAILAAVENDTIGLHRIKESVKKIVKLKLKLG